MTESDYAFIVAFLRRRSGLSLGPEKQYLVESRLSPLCRRAGLEGVPGLVRVLRQDLGQDRMDDLADAVVSAMATHETLFFRDGAPFEALRRVVLPALAQRRPETIRIWSAAASTGQEAYSIAMLASEVREASEARPLLPPIDILATDISPDAVDRGRAGIYSQFEVQRGLPIRSLLRHFRQTQAGWEILPQLRATVDFRVFNLLDDLGPLGTFDVIFCRNLLIYLDPPTKRSLLDRLAGALRPQGVICLGSAETAVGLSRALEPHAEARSYFVGAKTPAATAIVRDRSAATV